MTHLFCIVCSFVKQIKKEEHKKINKQKENENKQKELSKKIKEFVQFNPDFTVEQVKDEIKKNSMFRRFFLKDPIRQNMYEKVVSEHISKINHVKNFQKLFNLKIILNIY